MQGEQRWVQMVQVSFTFYVTLASLTCPFPSNLPAHSRHSCEFEQLSMSDEPPYHNLHYFEVQANKMKNPGIDKNEVNSDECTSSENEYDSIESSSSLQSGVSNPTTRQGEASKYLTVELGGKIYAVVDRNKMEQRNIYKSLEQRDCSPDT